MEARCKQGLVMGIHLTFIASTSPQIKCSTRCFRHGHNFHNWLKCAKYHTVHLDSWCSMQWEGSSEAGRLKSTHIFIRKQHLAEKKTYWATSQGEGEGEEGVCAPQSMSGQLTAFTSASLFFFCTRKAIPLFLRLHRGCPTLDSF